MTVTRQILATAVIACFMSAGLAPAKDASTVPTDSGHLNFLRAVKRKTYSEALQSKFLANELTYFVSVSGPDFRILQVTAPLMDKPLADQIRHDDKNVAVWSELGFEVLELTDGEGKSWSMKLRGEK